jgi:hypothetical protein
MVMLELPALEEIKRSSEGLGTKVVTELNEIVREAECGSDMEDVEVTYWVYRMPSPGVRYYSYEG